MTTDPNLALLPGGARYPSLENRVVFITGGASGIGASLVLHFCDQGSRVAFVDVRSDLAQALTADIAARGLPPPWYRECDLRDVGALRGAIADAGAALGPIRALINNAGNDDRHTLDSVTPEYFDDRIAVNLRHQLFAAQAVRPQMREAGGGSIVNFNSITWTVADGDCVCYVTAKSAITGLTRALATELGPERIRVNGIAPGWIALDEAGHPHAHPYTLLGGASISPDYVARAAVFLASDHYSGFTTGATLTVDGGLSLYNHSIAQWECLA